jgi:hypothetical protein
MRRNLNRLYVKELALKNFAGLAAEQVADRMIELPLYVEEKLKSTRMRCRGPSRRLKIGLHLPKER